MSSCVPIFESGSLVPGNVKRGGLRASGAQNGKGARDGEGREMRWPRSDWRAAPSGMARETAETAQASSERVGAHLAMCTRTALFHAVRPSTCIRRQALLAVSVTTRAPDALLSVRRCDLLNDDGHAHSSEQMPLACNGTASRDGREEDGAAGCFRGARSRGQGAPSPTPRGEPLQKFGKSAAWLAKCPQVRHDHPHALMRRSLSQPLSVPRGVDRRVARHGAETER